MLVQRPFVLEIPLGLPDAVRLTHQIENTFLDGMKQMGRLIPKFGSDIFRIGIVCLFVNPECCPSRRSGLFQCPIAGWTGRNFIQEFT
jgi:hypothetical protein